MQATELRERVKREPLKPFRVHLRDGTSVEGQNPRLTLITSTTMAIGFPDATYTDVAHHVVFVSAEEIIRLEDLASALETSA